MYVLGCFSRLASLQTEWYWIGNPIRVCCSGVTLRQQRMFPAASNLCTYASFAALSVAAILLSLFLCSRHPLTSKGCFPLPEPPILHSPDADRKSFYVA